MSASLSVCLRAKLLLLLLRRQINRNPTGSIASMSGGRLEGGSFHRPAAAGGTCPSSRSAGHSDRWRAGSPPSSSDVDSLDNRSMWLQKKKKEKKRKREKKKIINE